jgi:hypothetical protein
MKLTQHAMQDSVRYQVFWKVSLCCLWWGDFGRFELAHCRHVQQISSGQELPSREIRRSPYSVHFTRQKTMSCQQVTICFTLSWATLIQCRTFYPIIVPLTSDLFPVTKILYVKSSWFPCVQHAQPISVPPADGDILNPKCQKCISAEFSNDLSRCVIVRLQAVTLSHFFIPVRRLSMEAGRNGRSATPCLSVCLSVCLNDCPSV